MPSVSILIPTYNRPMQLAQAVKSVRNTLDNVESIIIGDNSDKQGIADQNIMTAKEYKCKYLPLYQHACNLYKVHICMLSETNSRHVLILNDDDILVNSRLHTLAQKIVTTQNSVVSFNLVDKNYSKLLYKEQMFQTSSVDDVPLFWDGQFQIGATYYNRKCLLDSMNEWYNPHNILDFQFDECVTLLCIDKQRKYIHLPFTGSIIDKSNSMSISKTWSIFACRRYIDDIASKLKIRFTTCEQWKQIQLRELNDLCGGNLSFDDVFSNDSLMAVEQYIADNLEKLPLSIIIQNASQKLQNIFEKIYKDKGIDVHIRHTI